MAPLLHSRLVAWSFLLGMVLLTVGAMGLAAMRSVPLKMLPFDNKNELLLVLDFDKGTTLERSDAAVRDFEAYLAGVPEVADLHQLRRAWPRRWISTGWCGTTICARATTSPKCGSTWPARRTARCRATPSACGCATTCRRSPTAITRG